MKTIQQLFEDAGYECRSYSGRAMYGRNCLGVDIDRDKDVLEVIADVLQAWYDNADQNPSLGEIRELSESLRQAKQDSMGLGSIIYFPHDTYEESEDNCVACGEADGRNGEDETLCDNCGCDYDKE